MVLKGYQKAIIITVSIILGIGVIVGAGIGIFFACTSVLNSLKDTELYRKDVYDIVKKDYGCEKVLWFDFAVSNTQLLPRGKHLLSHYAICVVAEKNGEEVFLIIPSDTDEPGFFTEWKFDYSFTEIVAHMRSLGIYISDKDVNGDGAIYDGIRICEIRSDDEGYNRFDINVYFEYYCTDEEGNFLAYYYIMQEDHELRVYTKNNVTLQYEQLS